MKNTIRKRRITAAVAAVGLIAVLMPWLVGQVLAVKVQRQLDLLDQHPALNVLESHWYRGYGGSHGTAVLAERVGCGVRICSEIQVDFAAQHLSLNPLGWGVVVASVDLNQVLSHQLTPSLRPLNLVSQVGLFGQSKLKVQMSPSWHELGEGRADAIAFSGIAADFLATNYAARWQGDLSASFTVVTESASAEQRHRIGEVMQALGTQPVAHSEAVGAVVVRVVALMKELAMAVQLWQGKEYVWQPRIDPEPMADAKVVLKHGLPSNAQIKPLRLELAPDIIVASEVGQNPSVALRLPSFEAWHGNMPMPVVLQKLGPDTYEQEPELDIWQFSLQLTASKVSLNGLALWKQK